ncbi:MAG: hypothetical protein ACI9XC_001974 [Gammaproteobacteria bacterium]|jgi:hypothetical protein
MEIIIFSDNKTSLHLYVFFSRHFGVGQNPDKSIVYWRQIFFPRAQAPKGTYTGMTVMLYSYTVILAQARI